MILTNKHRLPFAFENFERAHPYDPGKSDISVTTLIDSPQITRLKSKHKDTLTEDVSDRIFSILGTAVHTILESAAADDCTVEERLYANWAEDGQDDIIIGGQIDLQSPHPDGGIILSDYKTTSAMTIQYNPDGKEEWTNQLNCYAALARINKIDVRSIEVIAVLRDWNRRSAERNHNYPQQAVIRVPMELWSQDTAEQYIEERLAIHADETAECTDAERWKRASKIKAYQLDRNGIMRRRATKAFDTRTEAETFALDNPDISLLVEDPPVYTRCEKYCAVSEFCPQWYKENQ